MNTFNRVLAVIVLLAVMIIAACILLVMTNLVTPERLGPLGRVVNLFPWGTRPIPTAIGAGLALLAGQFLLPAEFRRHRRRGKQVVVRDDELGTVSVSTRGVEHLVTSEAKRIGGVRAAKAKIDEGKDGLHVIQRVAVAPDANISNLSQELRERTKRAVEHYTGRHVREVRVDARLAG